MSLGLLITSLTLRHLNIHLLLLGPMLIVAGVVARRRRNAATPNSMSLPAMPRMRRFGLLAACNILLTVAAILADGAINERPLSFFCLISLTCALLAVLSRRDCSGLEVGLILCCATALSLVLRGSVFYLTPGFPGSDAWGHDLLTQAILSSARIPTHWENPYYLHYPAMHLTVALSALAAGASSKAALFTSVGIPLALISLTVFVVARRLSNRGVALLATLMVLFASYNLQWGTQIIPTSMGLSLYAMALMVTLRNPGSTATNTLLSLLIICAIVLCHTVSSFILWATLGALAVWPIIASSSQWPIHPTGINGQAPINLLLLTLVMVTHWSINPYTAAGESFFSRMVLNLQDSLATEAGFLNRPVMEVELLQQELLSTIGFALFHFLLVLGALLWLQTRQIRTGRRAIIAAVAVLSAISFIFPVFGIRNILPHRWFAFTWALAAPLAAVGLGAITVSLQNPTAKTLMAGLGMGLLVFMMITAPASNTDSPLGTAAVTQRLTYRQSELAASAWLASVAVGPAAADLQFGERILHDRDNLPVTLIQSGDPNRLQAAYYVWRSTGLEHPVQMSDGTPTVLSAAHLLDVEGNQSSIYSGRSVIVFTTMQVGGTHVR